MAKILEFQMIDGIKCYSPKNAFDYHNYPEGGFEVIDSSSESSFWVASRNRLFKFLIRKYCVHNQNTILDIGCATGNLIKHIVEYKDLTITGSEIYVNGLVYAKNNLPNVEFIQYDVAEGVIDKHFDLITAFDVIEHIDNDHNALENMNHMLSDSGVLIISVPQYQFLFGALDKIVHHKRRYSQKLLIGKLEAVGFKIEYVTSFVSLLFPLMLISRIMERKFNPNTPAQQALKEKATFSPIINKIFDILMRFDEVLIKNNISLPFGGTLIVVARK
jgi:2-polyprenyl-3-methyl-5-hydroxy-6-metoxy-1,4-benzoquinol methylase